MEAQKLKGLEASLPHFLCDKEEQKLSGEIK